MLLSLVSQGKQSLTLEQDQNMLKLAVMLRTTKEKDMVFNVLQAQKGKWKVVQMSQFPIHFLAQTKKVEVYFVAGFIYLFKYEISTAL